MANIQKSLTIQRSESKSEQRKTSDSKAKVSVRFPKRLEKLSRQIDRIREMEGDTSMFRSRFRLPYSSPESIRLHKKHELEKRPFDA